MWDNLLSGTIGSVVGVIGAVVIALLGVRWTRRQAADAAEIARRDQVRHAELQRQIDKSGDLANHLVALYEELRIVVRRGSEPTAMDLDRLRILASDFRRSVVVDAPLLPVELEEALKRSRTLITALLDEPDSAITKARLVAAQDSVRSGGDELRRFRQRKTDEARAKW